MVAGKPLNSTARKMYPSPAIFDVDNDGKMELIAVYSAMLNGVTKKEEQKKVMESKEFKVLSKKLRFATEKVKV